MCRGFLLWHFCPMRVFSCRVFLVRVFLAGGSPVEVFFCMRFSSGGGFLCRGFVPVEVFSCKSFLLYGFSPFGLLRVFSM